MRTIHSVYILAVAPQNCSLKIENISQGRHCIESVDTFQLIVFGRLCVQSASRFILLLLIQCGNG